MSDGPVKSESADRIDRFTDLIEAERELRAAVTTFEQAQRSVVSAAEQVQTWADQWICCRNRVLQVIPATMTAEAVTWRGTDSALAEANRVMRRFCGDVAEKNRAIAALEPHTEGPSPETIRTFDLMSEDEYCDAFRDRIIADEAEQQASVDMAAAVERAKAEGAKAREAGEDCTACPYPQDSLEATAWTGGWIDPQASEGENVVTVTLPQGSMTEEQVVAAIQEAGGYAPVTEPQPVVDPTAKFWGEGLMRAAEPKPERAYWPFGGKLVGG